MLNFFIEKLKVFSFFWGFLIFFKKSTISLNIKAFESDSIGRRCFTFLNLFDAGAPTISRKVDIFLRNEYFFSNFSISILKSSYSPSEILGLLALGILHIPAILISPLFYFTLVIVPYGEVLMRSGMSAVIVQLLKQES